MKKKIGMLISTMALAFALQVGVSQDQVDDKANIVEQNSQEIMMFSDPHIKGVGK